MSEPISLPSELVTIAKAIAVSGGQAILIGGVVRDHFLGQPYPKDFDIEVYRIQPAALEKLLHPFGKIHGVGKSFGVLKLVTEISEYDFSLPRRESKIGIGHKGFLVASDPGMTFEEAASRRDFTINAIGYDILEEVFYDPFHGINDLQQKILKHIGPAFSEDPLRVLRAMQFSARFHLHINSTTVQLCRQLNLSELPKERIFEEFKKLLLKAEQPSLGLEAAKNLNILVLFPELEALVGVPQDPEWHPEGDVWTHTLMVIDEAAKLRVGKEKSDLAFMLGALCHDFGKPVTTFFHEGHWRSPAHDVQGMVPTEQFLRRMTDESGLIDQVKLYVKEHLKPALLYNARAEVKPGAIRRLALKISIPDLIRLATADHFGRTTAEALARQFPAGDWLLKQAENLNVQASAPTPLLMGRHLLELGVPPGPQMGILLKQAFALQLDGQLDSLETAFQWAKDRLKQPFS